MTKMIMIPSLILVLIILYAIFEVQIAHGLAWLSGDGMINWYALSRLEYYQKKDRVLRLANNADAKTRLFALHSAMAMGEHAVIAPLIEDPSWEVRMQAIDYARKVGNGEAGTAIVRRILDYEPLGASVRSAQFERLALVEALPPTSSRLNAESVSHLACSTSPEVTHQARRAALEALRNLGPLAEAEEAYRTILENPRALRATNDDVANALIGAGVLRFEGALPVLIRYARRGPHQLQLQAVEALSFHGGPIAERMLEEFAERPPPEVVESSHEKTKRETAELGLRQLRARARGEPVPESLEPEGSAEGGGVDLLAGYGSSASESGTSPSAETPPTPEADPEEEPEPEAEPTPGPDAPDAGEDDEDDEGDEDDLLAAYGTGS